MNLHKMSEDPLATLEAATFAPRPRPRLSLTADLSAAGEKRHETVSNFHHWGSLTGIPTDKPPTIADAALI